MKKLFRNRAGNVLAVVGAFVALAIFAFTATGMAQQTPAPASIHGKVTNPAGFPITKGDVKLTTDKTGEAKDRKYKYSFPIDAQGNYKGDGITPGDYLAVVMVDDKSVDFIENASLKPGADFEGNFDMTRKEYIDKMTPEEKKQLEEFKKKNADTMAANSKIANLNTLLATARADIKSGDFDGAIKAMNDATTAKPDEAILWLTLGDAQLSSGAAAQTAARTAHTSPMDAAIVEKFTAAAASYQKAIDTNTASKKPNPETGATAYNQLGQALGRSGKTKESADAYDNAAKADPAGAGKYLYNEAATLFNAGDMDGAAVAADKAIAADPKRPDIYYIKGQSLVSKATVDPKTQKIVAPPGCIEAYQTYLQLAPDGPHAADVKQVLDGFGAKIESSYKATKSKK